MSLCLSEMAANHVQQYLALRQKGLGIRLVVQTSECSGMAYLIEVVDEASEYDLVFENHGARIYIDPKSLVYVDGTVIDYVTKDGDAGFVVNNPNVVNRCGCGESFYV